jgi:Amt family ammonium transporter
MSIPHMKHNRIKAYGNLFFFNFISSGIFKIKPTYHTQHQATTSSDDPPTVESNKIAIDLVQTHADYVWTLVVAALVFFMQTGFAMVEAGFTRAKNAINIMMKNLMDFSLGSLAFWAIGFGIMFGASNTGWFGTSGFFLSDFKAGGDPWVLAFWMFQVVFAATAT